MNIAPIFAKKIVCTVESIVWMTRDVFCLRFAPNKKFQYDAGQFISIYIPSINGQKPFRRAYSLATAQREDGYELMVKVVEGGIGSNFLAGLKPGQSFEATAPYGDFRFESHEERRICFIATGTGIAPLLSLARSEDFVTAHQPMLIFGAREESEILCSNFFEAAGFKTTYCLSRASSTNPNAYTGRITHYLRSLPASWPFHATDFYLCGSGQMIAEVVNLLSAERAVARSAIFAEAFFNAYSHTPSIKEAA
jgi:ferredoxin-NADP reductase